MEFADRECLRGKVDIRLAYPAKCRSTRTALGCRPESGSRVTDRNCDHYNTRRVVYRPRHISAEQLKNGYDRAYREFYAWRNIGRSALTQPTLFKAARHLAYAGGRKKLEPMWTP